MILAKLYSNLPAIFPPIHFRRGLNVVLAKVLERKDQTRDSHCVGKTLLIDVIDFCLLRKGKPPFLKDHPDRFADFVFFLEVLTADGVITIRRSVEESSRASFKRQEGLDADLTHLPESQWDHWQLPFERAVEWLDASLGLTLLKPFSYRTGKPYVFRSQSDFDDIFHPGAGREHDRNWKPYLAHVFGLNADLLLRKYGLDDDLNFKTKVYRDAEKQASFGEEEYDRLKGQIEVKQDEVDSKQRRIDDFDFHEKEIELTTQLVDEVEARSSELNTEIYNLKFDIEQAAQGLHVELHFDMTEVEAVFQEAQLYFPDQLKQSYSDLLAFNQKIMQERRTHLSARLVELREQLALAEGEHAALAARRVELLAVLKQRDSLKKYKQLQATIDGDRAELSLLKEKFRRVEELIALRNEIDELKKKRDAAGSEVREMVRSASDVSDRYRAIRLQFAKLVKDVLFAPAEMFLRANDSGNLEFKADFQNPSKASDFTSEGEGTTYKKFLCMAFDMAVLQTCSQQRFFHFVYHDGALETEDNRRKNQWLEAVRQACDEHGLQYIMTVLEDDLPRDEHDQKVPFSPTEIIRELHDRGDDGRLFRMPKF